MKKKVNMEGITVHMDREKIAAYREQFDELDIGDDGKLSRENVAQILSDESEQIERLMVTLLFEKYDVNNDGMIDFDEFCNFCLDMNGLTERDILKQIFDLCDVDHNGVLDVEEVHRLGKLMGLNVTHKDANATVKALDYNNDSKVDFEEFCTICTY